MSLIKHTHLQKNGTGHTSPVGNSSDKKISDFPVDECVRENPKKLSEFDLLSHHQSDALACLGVLLSDLESRLSPVLYSDEDTRSIDQSIGMLDFDVRTELGRNSAHHLHLTECLNLRVKLLIARLGV